MFIEVDDRRDELVAALARRGVQVTVERAGLAIVGPDETVYDHVRRIRAKYAALDRPSRTKVELYRRAVEDGIVPPER